MLLAHVAHVMRLVDRYGEERLTENSFFYGAFRRRDIPRASILLFGLPVIVVHISKYSLMPKSSARYPS